MKILIKVFPVLLFISFFCISWINFEDKKTADTCIVELSEDIYINFWDSSQIDAFTNRPPSEIEEIIWSPSDNLSCTDCLNPILTITETEDFCISLTIKFDDGCEASDELCITILGCGDTYSENKINSITPESISNTALLELEIVQTQYVHFEIVENDEISHTIREGWLFDGLQTVGLDFSQVPAGNHNLRVRLYPENKFISITKL